MCLFYQIFGLDFQEQYESISFQLRGSKPPLAICSLTTLKVESPNLFANLTTDFHPIATKSQRYSYEDRKFIDLRFGSYILKESLSPLTQLGELKLWLLRNENHKMLVIDDLQTVNHFTLLDAYPLP